MKRRRTKSPDEPRWVRNAWLVPAGIIGLFVLVSAGSPECIFLLWGLSSLIGVLLIPLGIAWAIWLVAILVRDCRRS